MTLKENYKIYDYFSLEMVLITMLNASHIKYQYQNITKYILHR